MAASLILIMLLIGVAAVVIELIIIGIVVIVREIIARKRSRQE